MPDKPLVLVCDDQPHILLTLSYLVKSIGGVEVITANNGQDAMKLAIDRKPVLLLMDVMMPNMDGYSACAQIRQAWGDYRGQIWFITARGSHTDLDHAREVGADRCINKPFDPDQILQLVRQALAPARAA
jgi:two-component system, OmpR family, alkaline phosphatase synthesis response regulator PhoP